MTDVRAGRVRRGGLAGLAGAFVVAALLTPPASAASDASAGSAKPVGSGAPSASATEPFVIGGHDATEEYPFMASLQRNGQHGCGASLIKKNYLVTAAHCVAGTQPDGLTARIGSPDRTSGGTEAKVTEITVHPEYQADRLHSDVAVLKLDRAVPQQPIELAARSGEPGTGTRILGWGQTCEDQRPECGQAPVRLQELDTEIVGAERCTGINGRNELCTDSPTENAMGCFGDSGGPQLQGRPGEWKLIGATSRDGDNKPKCATGPGIWTDLTAHRDWIEQNTAA